MKYLLKQYTIENHVVSIAEEKTFLKHLAGILNSSSFNTIIRDSTIMFPRNKSYNNFLYTVYNTSRITLLRNGLLENFPEGSRKSPRIHLRRGRPLYSFSATPSGNIMIVHWNSIQGNVAQAKPFCYNKNNAPSEIVKVTSRFF